MSSEDENEEETQENLLNIKHRDKNKQLNTLQIDNSENSVEDDFTEERRPPEPPPDQPSTSGLFKTQKNIIEYRDQLTMRKHNYVYFVTEKGKPRDVYSKLLEKCGKLPKFKNLQKGIVKKLRKGHQYHFALPIENEFKTSLGETTKDIKLSIYSLHSVVDKLNLKSISIAKSTHINNVLWEEILATLKIAFLNSPVKVIICIGITQYPTKEQRNQLIEKAHSSAVGGPKGVTKTCNRIRQRYYWENMKLHIQKYMQLCLQCQLKKLIRVKTKNPMVITDTPGTAFEKISMDIVGRLPITSSQNQYILTIQDNFTKYSLAIPLPNHQVGTIADAFVKKFICIYGSPKAVLTDQAADFLSNLMRKMAKRFRIRQFKSTAYHPQSNGSLERSHYVLKGYLKQFIDSCSSLLGSGRSSSRSSHL